MLNFQVFYDKKVTLSELVAGLTPDNLRKLTDEMVDTVLGLIAGCVDADVTFQPTDPQANDPYAATSAERHMAWTLGHAIVHITSSAEESAALAAELARGVAFHGRSRYERCGRSRGVASGWRRAGGCAWRAWGCGRSQRTSITRFRHGRMDRR